MRHTAPVAPLARVALSAIALAACPASQQAGHGTAATSNSTATTTPAGSWAATRAPSASASAAAAPEPLPDITRVVRLTLEQGQGGPSLRRCGGTVWRATVDFGKKELGYGSCSAGAPADTPPTETPRTLAPTDLDAVRAAYAKLASEPARSCGHDGGTLRLAVELGDATKTEYVDENWGCRKPAPLVAVGVRDFASLVRGLGR